MGILNFQNKNLGTFDFSMLRTGLRISEDNELLKKYDKDNNSIFDADELAEFLDDVENKLDENHDGTITQQEALKWAKQLGISAPKIGELESGKSNIVQDTLISLYTEQAKEYALETLGNDVQTGLCIADDAKGGDITQTWNAIKEVCKMENAESKVSQKLLNRYFGCMLLQSLKSGELTPEDIANELNTMEELLPGEGKEAELLHSRFMQFRSTILQFIKSLNIKSGDTINFDVLYKNITGVEFNPKRINEYKKKELQANFATSVNNKLSCIQYDLAEKVSPVYWDEENGKPLPALEFGNETEGPVFELRQLRESVENALNVYFGNDKEKISNYIKGYFNTENINGLSRKQLLQLAKAIYNDIGTKKNELLNKALDGNSLEDFSNELSSSYQKAFGEQKIDIAKEYADSQQAAMPVAKFLTGVASLAVVVASDGVLTPILLGTATSIGGIAVLDVVEGATKKGGMSDDDWNAMKEELGNALIFACAGVGTGLTSAKIGQTLLSKLSSQFMNKISALVLAKGVEYTSDFVMMMLTDLAIAGEINLTGETACEVLNIIMGIVAGKKALKGMTNGKKTPHETSQERSSQEITQQPKTQEQQVTTNRTADEILSNPNHVISSDEVHTIRTEIENIVNSNKTTAEKLEALHKLENDLAKMPENAETLALKKYFDSANEILNNTQEVENILREAGFKEDGEWKDDLTLEDELFELMNTGEEKIYKTKDGEVSIKYDKDSDRFVINKDKNNERILEGGIKDTELTEVAHEARHLAGPTDRVATPLNDPALAEKICNELNLSNEDKVILANLREGNTHIIDGPDNTQIKITKTSDNYSVEIIQKTSSAEAKNATNFKGKRSTNPAEIQQGIMQKNVGYDINPDRLPVLEIGGECLDLNYPDYAKAIFSLKEGESLTIGREGMISIGTNNDYISRQHVVIYKEHGKIKIADISANGTRVASSAENAYVSSITNGNMMQNISYEISPKKLPKIELPGGIKIDLSNYKSTILSLQEGQCISIGREGNIVVNGNDYISRQHIIVYKSNGVLKIKNISQNSATIVSNGYLDKINDKINSILEKFKNSEKFSHINLTPHEQSLFNAFKDFPEVKALIKKPKQLKEFLRNADNIICNRGFVSDEVADAIINGQARLNGNNPEYVKCSVNQNIIKDIVKMAKGEDYIAHYPAGTKANKILKELPVGEVANIGGKLYVNNGTNLESINLSEERFRQLFPPVKRFSTHQGAYEGDCYLVSVLERMYDSPLGRVKLYRRIGEDANGIYTLTANNNYEKTYFRRFDSRNKHIEEEGGLAILEQGWCKNSARAARQFNPRETVIMQVNEGGFSHWAIGGLIGRQPTVTNDIQTMRQYIMRFANDENMIINVGTKSGGYNDDTHFHSRQYNIYTSHEYSIMGYNEQTDCILLCNPHHSGCIIDVPLNEFLRYCDHFTMINMNS